MSEAGGSKRVRDPEGARRALVATGVDLFEKRGYASTSVQSIVDGAGLTKGAFYHHFASKDDLLRSVHDDFIDYQLDRAREVMDRPGLAADERLRRLVIDALLEPMAIYKAEITVFLQERRFLSGETFSEIENKRAEFERYFVQVIDGGMNEGVFRRLGPARIVAFGIIGMGAWTHQWLDLVGVMTPVQIGELYAEIFIGGLIST